MSDIVSYTDVDGRKRWTATGSRAHRDHLAADQGATADVPSGEPRVDDTVRPVDPSPAAKPKRATPVTTTSSA